jgi:hypothetical protein
VSWKEMGIITDCIQRGMEAEVIEVHIRFYFVTTLKRVINKSDLAPPLANIPVAVSSGRNVRRALLF